MTPFGAVALVGVTGTPSCSDETELRAASALRRSFSLKLLERPPPGVLAPEYIELARERTFMTRGLKRKRKRKRKGNI